MGESSREFFRWRAMLEQIAKNGIRFTPNIYDRERYEEIQKIALEMGNGDPLFDSPEPVIDLRDENDNSVAERYVTPKVGISAAIINERGELLLTQRKASGNWDLLGGYADVGYSAAEVAVKEAKEEVGLDIEVLELLGIFDSLQLNMQVPHYGLVFSAKVVGGELSFHPLEVADAQWFTRATLPESLRDVPSWLELALSAAEGTWRVPYFDPPRASVLHDSVTEQSTDRALVK